MNCTVLLRKLVAIEHMIGKADDNTLRTLLYDAEDCVIQIQDAHGKSFLADALNQEASRLEPVGEAS
jgi:hypothetical protein